MATEQEKTKVLHVITRFDKGGSAENTFLTVRHLDRNRYEAVLATGPAAEGIASNPEATAISANLRALADSDARLIRLPKLVRDLHPNADLAAFVSLIALIRRERPVIVHTHTSKAGILGRWAAWLCRVPLIVHTPHGHVFFGYFGPPLSRLFIWVERWTAAITDVIVTLTPREKADHVKFRIAPEQKIAVIHSGVDLKPFFDVAAPDVGSSPATSDGVNHNAGTRTDSTTPPEDESRRRNREASRRNARIPPGATVVASAGRLTAVKGHDVLIRAVAECHRQGVSILLLLLGEGERRAELEALAKRLGIGEHVRFLGWRPDVARTLAACDLFCLPSRNEGMGKVLVEAMALGKPIVASDVGGIPDLVHPGENGLLVPVGDVTALAAAIVHLARDPVERRRMGEAGRRIAPAYSLEGMIKQIDELYAKLLSDRCVQPKPETAP